MIHKMKKMGKWVKGITILLTVVMLLPGCARKEEKAEPMIQEGQSDIQYIQEKGTLVVGVTEYPPMCYRGEEDWTGFDVNLAKAFADSLGVELYIREIDWNRKTELLENGSIDCIWNGMTKTKELQETISCSCSYLSNAQVIVLRNSMAEKYQTLDACQHMLFAVEAGSTAESLLKEKKYRYIAYPTQAAALQSVQEKKTDAAVIDNIMASYYTGGEREFSDLTIVGSLDDEKICVGFRKNSDLTKTANAFLQAAYENGDITSLAERYGIREAVLSDGEPEAE